ncbi:MAG TPA: carboxypeptidase regulatory-like domain-containing protein [Candidatus Hydrogenedentes bacterium]|nr:carboxypeptidase regulatory-like domain-containing protein [Candidatus Hydrogenedentota bacterium]
MRQTYSLETLIVVRRRLLCLVGIMPVFFAACSCREAREPTTPSAASQAAPSETVAPQEYTTAPMRVVTLSGAPLSGMIPIATLHPNAFDEPIASGPPTDANGESRIRFPVEQKLALRAWDPNLLYFPNNFFDVLPGGGAVRETLVIRMVESASVEAALFTPDGAPIARENAGMMLFHPVHGPWWPAAADTDDNGKVTFHRVPPGEYVIRIKVASGGVVEIPETYVAPNETTRIGAVHLR